MNTRIDVEQQDLSDIESGAVDSGLVDDVVCRQTPKAVHKACDDEEVDDPKGEINCYGVGVIKIDAMNEDASKG